MMTFTLVLKFFTTSSVFTVRKNSEDATDEELGRLEVVGEYHLGEFIDRFWHGSVVMRLPDSYVGQIPTVIFGTVNGVIGVICLTSSRTLCLSREASDKLEASDKGCWRTKPRAMEWRLEKLCKRVELTRLH
ncbi:hypothetical protein M0R45_000355 [Rubus argutus]|uniref:RSE1/DDB1/CPSF1 C-terminal domain-containing protein n=1 Tax=Rubus argutus TaxID=59490 RepID=A0AAW1VM06_RUBAR